MKNHLLLVFQTIFILSIVSPIASAQETFNNGILIGIPSNATNGVGWGNGTLGIRHDGNNGLDFFTQGSSKLRILSNGNIGLGVNPTKKLDIGGSARLISSSYIDFSIERSDNNAKMTLGITSGSLEGFISSNGSIKFLTNQESTPKMFITSGGKVGIGTNTPRVNLHTNGPIESQSSSIIAYSNSLASSDYVSTNTYRAFSGATFTNGSGATLGSFFTYRSVHGGYLDHNNEGFGFYSQGGYPRMFMEVISSNHGTFSNLPADSPIKNGYMYQQIKGPTAGPVAYVKATNSNSTWLWGIKNDGTLEVQKGIKTKEVNVTLDGWADYVFEKDYPLMSLTDLEKYIFTNKHLPEVPDQESVSENGVNVGEMQTLLLKKIEELTLHIIQLNKEIEALKHK